MDEYDRLSNQSVDDDPYEPPVKRTTSSSRKTTTTIREQPAVSTATSTGSVKRTSAGVPVSTRMSSSISAVVCYSFHNNHFFSFVYLKAKSNINYAIKFRSRNNFSYESSTIGYRRRCYCMSFLYFNYIFIDVIHL
jgi:hypothetical protein